VELLPTLTASENIMLVLARNHTEQEAAAIARQALFKVEMDEYANSLPSELSAGQQQRIAIARALAFPSPFLIMDEPFRGIDNALCTRIIERIRESRQQRRQTLLFTSHHWQELHGLADHIIEL
jgi:ABC-type nitrate/sulfonate/bicarbonate transport system ATPase subunit